MRSSDARTAHGLLTEREIERFRLETGEETKNFYLSIAYNGSVLLKPKLRFLVEDVCGGADFARRYKRRCEQLHRSWPNFDPRPSADWLLEVEHDRY